MSKVIIYSDGAYSALRDQGGWAFVVLQDNKKIHSDFDCEKHTTNNRMEVRGVMKAVEYCKQNNITEFQLFTDSMYVIGTMTLNWKRKKNVDLWLELDDLCEDLNIEWTHEKGHAGNKWNEYCDTLAVQASHIGD